MDVDHHRDRVVERVVDCAAIAFEKKPHEPGAKWFSSEAWALGGARCCALKVVKESHKTINNLIKDAFFKAWLRGCTPGKPFTPYAWFAQLDVECAALVMHRAIAELVSKRSAANYQHILRLARKSYLESKEKEAHRAIEAGESRRLFENCQRPQAEAEETPPWARGRGGSSTLQTSSRERLPAKRRPGCRKTRWSCC